MDNDVKWYFIMMGFIMVAMFGAFAIDSMAKSRCKMEAIKEHVSVEAAERLCR